MRAISRKKMLAVNNHRNDYHPPFTVPIFEFTIVARSSVCLRSEFRSEFSCTRPTEYTPHAFETTRKRANRINSVNLFACVIGEAIPFDFPSRDWLTKAPPALVCVSPRAEPAMFNSRSVRGNRFVMSILPKLLPGVARACLFVARRSSATTATLARLVLIFTWKILDAVNGFAFAGNASYLLMTATRVIA